MALQNTTLEKGERMENHMKIIISPAKKMNVDTDSLPVEGVPVFLQETEKIKQWIQGLSWSEAAALWKCSDKLVDLNYERFRDMDLTRNLTPAVLSYEGIQYQYMNPAVMDASQLAYIQKHLRILSGFYGILSPFDGVVPYRLEMQSRAGADGCKNLYQFWKDKIYGELTREDSVILNLASKEYSKAVEPYLRETDRFITCIFAEEKNGKITQKATMAKMARGEMVNFLASVNAREPEEAKAFDRLGFSYREDLSKEEEYVFLLQ